MMKMQALPGICYFFLCVSFKSRENFKDFALIIGSFLNSVPKIVCVLATAVIAILILMKLRTFMEKSMEKLRKSVIKISWCLAVFFLCGLASIAMEFRVNFNIDYWDDSLYEFLICRARQSTQIYKCNELLEKPDKVYRIIMEICTCLPSIVVFFLLFDPIKELRITWKEVIFKLLGLIVENGKFSSHVKKIIQYLMKGFFICFSYPFEIWWKTASS